MKHQTRMTYQGRIYIGEIDHIRLIVKKDIERHTSALVTWGVPSIGFALICVVALVYGGF